MSQHDHSPETLQDLCFFTIADELESYSPDALVAHLPPTLRSMLLLRLPVMDVIKLEATSAVRGINMNTVWEKLYNQWHHLFNLVDYPFEKSAFLLDGGWKEYYLSISSSIILNPYKHQRSVHYYSERCFCTMLFTYYWYLFTPYHYIGFEGELNTPWARASYLMKQCNYRPKVVYISCSLFFRSPFWEERDAVEVSSTLREFLSDTREIVFTSDDEEMNKWNADDQYEFLQCTSISYGGLNKLCDYVLDMILSSSNPKLESVRTNDKCPDWIVEAIIQTLILVCTFVQRSQWLGMKNTYLQQFRTNS